MGDGDSRSGKRERKKQHLNIEEEMHQSKRSGMSGGGLSLMGATKKAPRSPRKPHGSSRDQEGAKRVEDTPGFKEERKRNR